MAIKTAELTFTDGMHFDVATGSARQFAFDDLASDGLGPIETVLASDQPSRYTGVRRFAWVIPALIVVAAVAWWWTRGSRRWHDALARLETEPGIAVIRSERTNGKWHVTGMRDPLATNTSEEGKQRNRRTEFDIEEIGGGRFELATRPCDPNPQRRKF